MAEAEEAKPMAEDPEPAEEPEAEDERWKRRRIEGEAEAEKAEDAEDTGKADDWQSSWKEDDSKGWEDKGHETNGEKSWQQKEWEEEKEDKSWETNGEKSWQQKDWEEKEDKGWEASGEKSWQQKGWEEDKEDKGCESNAEKRWEQKDEGEEKEDKGCETKGEKQWEQKDEEEVKEEAKDASAEEPKAKEAEGEKAEENGWKKEEAEGEKPEGSSWKQQEEAKDAAAEESKAEKAQGERTEGDSWKRQEEQAMDVTEEKSGDANGEQKWDKAMDTSEEKSGEANGEKEEEKAMDTSEEKSGEANGEKGEEKAAEEASEEKSWEATEEKTGDKEEEGGWSKSGEEGWGSSWEQKEWDKKEDWGKSDEAAEANDGEAKAEEEGETKEEEAKDDDADEEEEWRGTLKLDIGWEDAAWLLENEGKRIKRLEELSGADVKVREAGTLRLRPREGAAPAAASASWPEQCAKALCAMHTGGDVEVYPLPPAGPCSGLPLSVVEVPAAVPLNFVKGKNGNRMMDSGEEMGVVAVFATEGQPPEGEKKEEEGAKKEEEKEEKEEPQLEVGGKAEGKYGNSWFEATIVEVGESLVKVKWGFDGSEEELARENVRAVEAPKKEEEPSLEAGAKVEGKYGDSWFEATLLEVGENVVKVRWGFDDSEEELIRANVRFMEIPKKEEEEKPPEIEPGSKVQGKYGADWFDAEVVEVNGGIVKVRWGFDGNEEELARSNVKLIPPPEEPPEEPEEPPNKVLIYGGERGRMEMELRLMNLMELKAPGCLAKRPRREDRCEGLGWSHSQLMLEGKARGRLIGKGGATRKRIAKICGSSLEYVGDFAQIVGTGEERQRTVAILDMMQAGDGFQIKAVPSIFEAACTRLKVPKEAAGSVTGQRRSQVNHVEDETGTLVFMQPAAGSSAGSGGAERLTLHEGQLVEGKCKGEWLEATVLKVMNWSADDDDEDDETDGRTVTLKWAKDGREAIVPMTVVREKMEGDAAEERSRLDELANSVTLLILGPERSRQIAQLRIMGLVEAGKPGTFSAAKLTTAFSARVRELPEQEAQRCQQDEVLARMATVAAAAGCLMWPVGRSLCFLGSEEACTLGQEYVRVLLVSTPSVAEVDAMARSSYGALLVPKDKSKNLSAEAMAPVEQEFEVFAFFDDGAGLAGIEDSVRVIVCGRDEGKREAALEKLKILQDVEVEPGNDDSWGEKTAWDEKKDWEEKKDGEDKRDWDEKKDWEEKTDWGDKKEDNKWGEQKKWDEKSSWNEDSKDSRDSKGWGDKNDWQSKSWDDKAGRDEGQSWKGSKAASSWGESKDWEKKSSWDEDKDWKNKGGWGESRGSDDRDKNGWGDRDNEQNRSWDSKKRSWPEDDWKSNKRGREAEQEQTPSWSARDSRDQGRGSSERRGRDSRSWGESSVEGKGATKLDVSSPELEAGDDKESPKEDPQQTEAAEESEKKQDEDEESGESSAESSGENTEEAAKEATAKAARKDWEAAEPFGHRWQEGDVLCCAATLPGGRAAFGLNGDFEEPMGQAFDLQLPPGTQLCLVVAAGDGGRLSVNLGQVAFAHPPPTPEHRGLGEAMRIRPTWRVKLPKAVKAWPVFAGPSRQAEGRKALKDFEVVEQIELRDGWLRHEAGWSPCQMTVVSQEYDALQPIAAWQAIDRPERPKKERKAIKRTVHASFDTEFCSQNHWNFRGPEHATAAFGPAMLLSTESAATGILRWCIKSEGSNKSFEVGVIPASHSEEKNFLHETCECGVKSTGVSGGDQKSAFDIHKKYVEVIADMNERKAKFLVGDTRDQMVEMKTLDIPYEDDVRLAVTGWANVQCRLEPPRADRAAESDDSEEDDDSEGPLVTSCGNAVQANTWHVATITVDLPAGRLGVMLDGEPHLVVHDPAGLVSDGPLAIDPSEGLMLFSATRRGGGLLGEQDWRAGGHLRSLRLDHGVLSQFEIWSQHLPKGIWIGRCGARNPADARICWRCRAPRQRTGVRPPGDADPRHEGLTVVTAESFRELVLEAPRHVFVVATAAWCGACNQLKPRWARLAQLLSAEPSVTIATIDIDENELHSRHFPESFIPNAKLFILGKKRQPVTYQNVASASFEELASFLQQHTGISMQAAIERGYPAYCERLGVDRFLESIRDVALGVPIPRMPGRTGLQAMAAFFVGHLLDPEQTSVPPAPSSIDQLPLPGPPGAPLALRRTVSDAPQPTLLGPPPLLVRALSGETRAVPLSVPPAFGLGASDPSLTERLCSELLNNRLSGLLRSSQPEDPQGFARQFFLHQARPIYCHRNFFNARVWTSWQLPPRAVQFVAAVRVLRALMRWVRRRGVQLALPQWAPQTITAMSSAAHRHNWRRVEGAIMGEDPQYGLADLQLILERGFDVDAAPFGVTPLLLAAAVGNLQAVQYLFVHGANPHVEGGRPLLMPVEAAARHGHLRIVEFFIENGAVPSRALHFAAAGGATDVVAYLLRRGASPDVRIGGLSAVAVALLARQHRMVEMLIPHCRSAAISAPMPEDGCMASGIADGSTLLHLAASIGGLCELSVKELVRNGSLESVKNKRGELAFDLMAATLKAVVRPSYCCGFVHIADAGGSKARLSAVRAALANGADVAALDVRGFSLLDLACFCGDTDLAELLLEARAPVAVRGPTYPSALMWAHWRECEDIIVLLTSRGASLSNADLEGLQRLRSSWASLTSTEGDSSTNLMMPEPEHLWKGCAPSSSGFLAAAQGLAARMAWGIGQAMGPAALTSLEEVGQPEDGEPAATAALVEALGRCAAPGGLSRAALLAQRCAAEGSGLQLPDLAVLRLLATDGGFHGACSSAFAALASQQPGPGEAERAQELRPAHARLQRALRALPARKAVCYRACRLPSPSGTARELLRGSRHGLDCYRPGSVVLWRHAASATLDPALARELALRGEPAAGVGVVFKVRRAVSPRPLAELSECPEHREVVFPPGAAFRVAGLFPCTERCLRRGSSGEVEAWAAEVGAAAQAGEALSWEAACRARNVLVVLDEEDAAAAFQRIELTM